MSEILKIAILDIKAGGGHKAASQSIFRSFVSDSRFRVLKYEFKSEQAERLHQIWTNTPILRKLYDVGHWFSEKTFVWRIKIDLLDRLLSPFPNLNLIKSIGEIEKEAKNFIDANPDIHVLISTHFFITNALQKLKSHYKYKFKIIVFVPDFDGAYVHFKSKKKIVPDALIARSDKMLNKVKKMYGVPVIKAGFIPEPEFLSVRKLQADAIWQRIGDLTLPEFKSLDRNKKIITIVAGSGWVHFFYPRFKKLLASLNSGKCNMQFCIICGSNQNAYRKYNALNQNHKLNVIAFPFISQLELALIYRISDLVIMASVAPATMFELMASTNANIIINRINPGQERPNKKYMLDHHLAKFMKDTEEISKFIKTSHSIENSEVPNENFIKEVEYSLYNAKSLPDFILNNFTHSQP